MSNITIPNKSPGDQHTAAEVNQQTGWTNSPMKSLGAFNPAMVFDSQGYYDKYTLTGDIVVSATGIVDGQVRTLWIETDGVHNITAGAGMSVSITDFTNVIAAGTYLFMFGSFPDETGVSSVVTSVPNIQFITITPPTLNTITIENAAPSDVVMVFNEVVTGTNLGFTLSGTTSTTFASISGSGTNTLTGVLSTPAAEGETITLSYDSGTGDIQGIQTALASITNQSVTNNISSYPLWTNTNSMIIDAEFEGDQTLQSGIMPVIGSSDAAVTYELWFKSTLDKGHTIVHFGDDNLFFKIQISMDATFQNIFYKKRSSSGNDVNYSATSGFAVADGWRKLVITDDGLGLDTSVEIDINDVDYFDTFTETGTYAGVGPAGANETIYIPLSDGATFGEGKFNLYRQFDSVLSGAERTNLGTSSPAGLSAALQAKCVLEKRFNGDHTSAIGTDGSAVGTPTFDADIPT